MGEIRGERKRGREGETDREREIERERERERERDTGLGSEGKKKDNRRTRRQITDDVLLKICFSHLQHYVPTICVQLYFYEDKLTDVQNERKIERKKKGENESMEGLLVLRYQDTKKCHDP